MKKENMFFCVLFCLIALLGGCVEAETEETETETEVVTDGDADGDVDGGGGTGDTVDWENIDMDLPEIPEPSCNTLLPDVFNTHVENGVMFLQVSSFYFSNPSEVNEITLYGTGLPGIKWQTEDSPPSLVGDVEDGVASFSFPLEDVLESISDSNRVIIYFKGSGSNLDSEIFPVYNSLAILNRLPRSQRQLLRCEVAGDGMTHCYIIFEVSGDALSPGGNQADYETVCEPLPAPVNVQGNRVVVNAEYLSNDNASIYIDPHSWGEERLSLENGMFYFEFPSDTPSGKYFIRIFEHVELGEYWPSVYRWPHFIERMEEGAQAYFACEGTGDYESAGLCTPAVEVVNEEGVINLLPAGNF